MNISFKKYLTIGFWNLSLFGLIFFPIASQANLEQKSNSSLYWQQVNDKQTFLEQIDKGEALEIALAYPQNKFLNSIDFMLFAPVLDYLFTWAHAPQSIVVEEEAIKFEEFVYYFDKVVNDRVTLAKEPQKVIGLYRKNHSEFSLSNANVYSYVKNLAAGCNKHLQYQIDVYNTLQVRKLQRQQIKNFTNFANSWNNYFSTICSFIPYLESYIDSPYFNELQVSLRLVESISFPMHKQRYKTYKALYFGYSDLFDDYVLAAVRTYYGEAIYRQIQRNLTYFYRSVMK